MICKVTNQEMDKHRMMKCEDGEYVAWDVYKDACWYYQKGLLTSQEVIDHNSLTKLYSNTMYNYVYLVLRHNKVYGHIKFIKTIEDKLSIYYYKKIVKELSILEHINLVKDIIAFIQDSPIVNYDKLLSPQEINWLKTRKDEEPSYPRNFNIHQQVVNRYLKGRKTLTTWKNYPKDL